MPLPTLTSWFLILIILFVLCRQRVSIFAAAMLAAESARSWAVATIGDAMWWFAFSGLAAWAGGLTLLLIISHRSVSLKLLEAAADAGANTGACATEFDRRIKERISQAIRAGLVRIADGRLELTPRGRRVIVAYRLSTVSVLARGRK